MQDVNGTTSKNETLSLDIILFYVLFCVCGVIYLVNNRNSHSILGNSPIKKSSVKSGVVDIWHAHTIIITET